MRDTRSMRYLDYDASLKQLPIGMICEVWPIVRF